MKFTELQKILEDKLGIIRLADIARELDVTPQVVSNWKSRDQVPYKNVKKLREKIRSLKTHDNYIENSENIPLDDANDINIFEIAYNFYKIFFKNVKMILAFTIFSFLSSVLYLQFFSIPVYHSFAKVLPFSEGKGSSKASSLASQFGFNISPGKAGGSLSSSLMIPEIVKSRRIANELLSYEFETEKFGRKLNLASIINISIFEGKEIKTDTISQRKKYNLISQARNLISISGKKDSPILRISAQTFEPKFARDLVNAVLERCGIIIDNYKFKELEEKKDYISKRMNDVRNDLIDVEEKLKIFRQQNRDIISSPSLMLEQGRLMRDVEVQTQLYIRLKSEFELVQIEAVGQRSKMQILDPPEIPIKKISPKPRELMFLSIFIGFFLGFGISIARDYILKNKFSLLLNNSHL